MMHTMQIIVKQDMQFVMQCNKIVNKAVNKLQEIQQSISKLNS